MLEGGGGAVEDKVRESRIKLYRMSSQPSLNSIGEVVTVRIEGKAPLGGIETEGWIRNP